MFIYISIYMFNNKHKYKYKYKFINTNIRKNYFIKTNYLKLSTIHFLYKKQLYNIL